MCINGTIAAGEINTTFEVFVSAELVNGGRQYVLNRAINGTKPYFTST